MTLTTMYNASETIKLDKALTTLATLNVRLLSPETDVVNPVFQLSGAPPNNCNYFQVPAWNRYYYVTSIEQNENGLWTMSGHVDVLRTARDIGLMSCSGIVARNATEYNGLLADDQMRVQQNPQIVTKSFPSGFRSDGADCVLIVAGG